VVVCVPDGDYCLDNAPLFFNSISFDMAAEEMTFLILPQSIHVTFPGLNGRRSTLVRGTCSLGMTASRSPLPRRMDIAIHTSAESGLCRHII